MGTQPTTQRGWWDLLLTQTPESMRWKADFDAELACIRSYLQGIGGMRECVRLCAEYAMQGGLPRGYFDALNNMHPRALMLLAKYGEEFIPPPFNQPPFGGTEPQRKRCFGNATFYQRMVNRMMREESESLRIDYVEGIAFGGSTEAVLHGWNTLYGSRFAVDWTWYAVSGWTLYWGIPFAEGEYRYLRKLAHPQCDHRPLFRSEHFPTIEEPIIRILERRARKITSTPHPAP
jgi:hypothetical protein